MWLQIQIYHKNIIQDLEYLSAYRIDKRTSKTKTEVLSEEIEKKLKDISS